MFDLVHQMRARIITSPGFSGDRILGARSVMGTRRVLVIGAGAAGSAAAAVLLHAVELDVVVVGEEDRSPFNRTTVNKGLLSGAVDDEGIALPGMDLPGVTWRLGERVVQLDPTARSVRLTDGEQLAADAVVLAVGAQPRRLPLSVEGPDRDAAVGRRFVPSTALYPPGGSPGPGSRAQVWAGVPPHAADCGLDPDLFRRAGNALDQAAAHLLARTMTSTDTGRRDRRRQRRPTLGRDLS
jgi:threonine dehydrogenase-like Zn-dependent dehydrogenase